MRTLKRCQVMLSAGVILLAVSYIVRALGYYLAVTRASMFVIEPAPLPIRHIHAMEAAAHVLKALGCALAALACSILFVDRQLPLKPVERLAALIGLLFFACLIATAPPSYWWPEPIPVWDVVRLMMLGH